MRSVSMQTLTDDTQAEYGPGVTIYGIGDLAHRGAPSGHNEDDTSGSLPEEEDADTKPEHRAIDVMIGPKFTTAQAWNFVAALVNIAANSRRLRYVIFSRTIWRARNGWKPEPYTGSDPHTNHVHVSGTAADDENGAHYVLRIAPPTPEEETVKFIYVKTDGPVGWALVGTSLVLVQTQAQANALAAIFGNAIEVDRDHWDRILSVYPPAAQA